MYQQKLIGRALLFVTVLCIFVTGFISTAIGGENQTDGSQDHRWRVDQAQQLS